ncbi:atrazine chlorohydrolase/5-methylthioadenosine/S-adenosylhomocysteine deaminase [Halohasta litchfieldiae]|jgi:atrazine chlorohydrolase/5-methylthioadenosine/S-adenosylhomocysteine deaminase|uniref:Atrazine chlorohydrolase/5-methylthioadenosine/S-adenosylhomocysteine deaminase n=1 Tax=Halohasta litchfieldiae TaxID=1073996 RepID=A0A1H6RVW5_9EURY|nr:amidohydrolase [Halohasta litchfieldiae]ATW89346.1 atrazine chlorohydrolase/5-methylthioadenosine/S-adenosylhomocysteine deaminase [Halohasta litchfieldiae]SEI59869.1 atrazine chlorohydrolase/5-methylthioadenosine/S-adenosylhomocysteine deaminase [Halohasta litchfieldiae]
MTDLLVTNGRVITQDTNRTVIEGGAVAIEGDEITAVGTTDELGSVHAADRVIDAEGGAVIPGLVNPHTHVSDILLRGSFAEDRGLLDWLYNVKRPGTLAMDPDEHALAATLYCIEAIQSGVTAFVENDTEVLWDDWSTIEAKLGVYDEAGIRNVYGAGMVDRGADAVFQELVTDIQAREDDVDHPPLETFVEETDDVIAEVDSLIETYDGTANGRQSIWPAPVVVETTTNRCFREAYALAEKHDVMTTAHVAEAEAQEQRDLSSIEYLRNVGYLGERTLLGHCVQIDASDIRTLAETGTAVAHNFMANMRLATGFAPVVKMLDTGVTVGLGTDNSILSDTVNPLSDVRAMAGGHKGYHRDAGVVDAQTAFDMITRDAATAIGRAESLGSLEAGTQADLAIVDLDHPHLTPSKDPVFTLVHAAQGFEVDTVVCAGDVIMENREIQTFDEPLDSILSRASEAATDIADRTGYK